MRLAAITNNKFGDVPMTIQLPKCLLGATLLVLSAIAIADEATPYTEGPVTNVSYVTVKPGMFNTYLKYLDSTYKPLMEQAKKQGIVLDYKIYRTSEAHNPSEPDLLLAVTYKNMAALDGLAERMDAVSEKLLGNRQKRDEAAISRESMRQVTGNRVLRELILK
jgi:hypothetical protein